VIIAALFTLIANDLWKIPPANAAAAISSTEVQWHGKHPPLFFYNAPADCGGGSTTGLFNIHYL